MRGASLAWRDRATRPAGGTIVRFALGSGVFLSIAACAGCARRQVGERQSVATADSGDVDVTVLLIGDAGRASDGNPVLAELTGQAATQSARTTVVFLGDNAYPAGLPDVGHRDRAMVEARLLANMAVSQRSGARSLFVAGNHDWADGSEDGWERVTRQQEFVERGGDGLIDFVPDGGCPGPVALDLGETIRIVLLDTQWMLQTSDKPVGAESPCPSKTVVDVFEGIDSLLQTAGARHVVVAAHHPLDTTGPHGGFFAWRDHVFPMRRLVSWLWVPLPGIGSLYPLVRSFGVSRQDLGSARYEFMRRSLDSVLVGHAPLVSVGGHDHSLQVMRGSSARFILVSGGGPSTGVTAVGSKDRTLFATGRGGFMRLDGLRSGRVRLGVYALQSPDSLGEVFSAWLDDGL